MPMCGKICSCRADPTTKTRDISLAVSIYSKLSGLPTVGDLWGIQHDNIWNSNEIYRATSAETF